MKSSTPNLTQRPPRSCRVRLGGYALLPRILDKCRALLAGTNGEYNYACPLDMRFFSFTGIDPEALKAQVAAGLGDGELLAWVEAHAPKPHEAWEIHQWSAFREQAAPADNDSRSYVSGAVSGAKADHREDLATWFEWLDMDDYVSFGGKP